MPERDWRPEQLIDILAFGLPLLVVLAARTGGGFAQTSWGAVLVTCGLVAIAAVCIRGVAFSPLEILAVACLVLFTGWVALSLAWTSSVPLTAEALERSLVPTAILLAALSVSRPESLWRMPQGVAFAAAGLAVDGLARGVDPPVGYANALASICIVGMILVVALALRQRNIAALIGAAIALVLFTAVVERAQTRAAWLALAGGAAVGFALRLKHPVVGVGFVLAGSGVLLAAAGLHSSVQREAYWRVSAHSIADHPVLGIAAGTWRREWLHDRHVEFIAQNAHSLYLETLTELGPFGLALLLIALLAPLAAAVVARSNPVVPWLAAAYSALLLHVGVDWHWQLTAVNAVAMFLAASLLAAARAEARTRVTLPRTAQVVVIAAVVVAGTVIWTQGAFVDSSQDRLRRGDWDGALKAADRAEMLEPWAAAPWRLRGQAEAATAAEAAAVASYRRALERDPNDPELWRLLESVATGGELRLARERQAQLNPLAPP